MGMQTESFSENREDDGDEEEGNDSVEIHFFMFCCSGCLSKVKAVD